MLIKTINLMVTLLAAILIFVLMAGSEAKVTGVCSNCHTMHNSQGGAAVVKDAGGTAQDTPVEFLLNRGGGSKTTCWGCHAQNTAVNVYGIIPQLRHTAADLAGGNFGYITGTKTPLGTGATTLTAGHNVLDTGVPDALSTPPGDEWATGITNANFTCAGQRGCHGDRTVTSVNLSMKGAHHTVDTVLKFGGPIAEGSQGSTAGLSYRFLKGVRGGEEANWEGSSPSPTVHNEYKGATAGTEGSDATTPGGGTISGLCSECHGNFHGGSTDIGGPTGTPWLRHPTDVLVPNSGEFTAMSTTYSTVTPMARLDIPNTIGSTVALGTGYLMCLSCHRAHASPNFKMTRGDYKNATLGTAISGCIVCHTSKN